MLNNLHRFSANKFSKTSNFRGKRSIKIKLFYRWVKSASEASRKNFGLDPADPPKNCLILTPLTPLTMLSFDPPDPH